MAEKLGLFNQLLWGDWAQRDAINRNAEDLSQVEQNVGKLREVVQRQQAEIVQLRAMFLGLIEVLHEKSGLDEAALERAVRDAHAKLAPPPPEPKKQATDPYRGLPGEPSAEDVEAAKALMKQAQDHHFSSRFKEARELYQQVVDKYGTTKQSATARQQLDNLKKA